MYQYIMMKRLFRSDKMVTFQEEVTTFCGQSDGRNDYRTK